MEKVKGRKTKLDETILAKSKRFVQEKEEVAVKKRPAQVEEQEIIKRKKPRHASVEGQRFLKSKEKALQREYAGSAVPLNKESSSPNKKKNKKKKGKKKKGAVVVAVVQQQKDNNSETEERYRKESLAYLQLWKVHKDHWKFEKLKQVWLLKHALIEGSIDTPCFQSLLEYISSIKGASRDKTLKEMESFMSDFERKFGCKNSLLNPSKAQEPQEQERKEYERARQIVQMLSDD